MNQLVTVVAVASLLCLSQTRAVARGAAPAAMQVGRAQTPPPGWPAAKSKALDLVLDGKDLEAVSVYEKWVAEHPNFAEGHFMLGAVHESVARAMFTSRVPDAAITRRKYFDAAVLHMRRALELAGREAPFWWIRALIDIHGVVGLNQPAEYERFVRKAVAEYPAEPLAHAYLLALLAGKGGPIDAVARAARGAIPKGPDARVELAGALVGFVQDFGRLTPALAPALLPEALRLVDEALKLKPGDAAALDTRARIQSMRTVSGQPPPADDRPVRGALYAIASAQLTYAATCGNGYYAPTLAALARPEPGNKLGFIREDFVPVKGARDLEKYQYRIEMTAAPSPKSGASCNGVPAGGSARTFSVTARPLEGVQGRSYRIDAEGTLTELK